jgi:hypothetical protein
MPDRRTFHSVFILKVRVSCSTFEKISTDLIIQFISVLIADVLPNKLLTAKTF